MIVTETLHYVLCPHCQKGKSRICHLFGQKISFGPWFCDECGTGFVGTVDDRKVTVEVCKTRKDISTVFLRRDNLVLVVEGMDWGHEESNSKFYYEQHTCPTNYLSSTREVFDLDTGEADPHGIFTFVGEVPEIEEPADIDINKMIEWLK